MTIEWLRDLIIVIFGITAIIATIIFVVLAFVIYARVRPILKSINNTAKTVERIISGVEEAVVKPIAQIASFFKGIRKAMGFMKRFTGQEEE